MALKSGQYREWVLAASILCGEVDREVSQMELPKCASFLEFGMLPLSYLHRHTDQSGIKDTKATPLGTNALLWLRFSWAAWASQQWL